VKTSQDLFKQLDEAESLFSKGSIKDAQKKVREVVDKYYNPTYQKDVILKSIN